MLMGRNPHAGGCALPSLYCWSNRAPRLNCSAGMLRTLQTGSLKEGTCFWSVRWVTSPCPSSRKFSHSEGVQQKQVLLVPPSFLVAHPGLWNGCLKISPCNQPIWHQYKDFLRHSMRVVSCCGFSVFAQVFCITHFLLVVGGWQEEQAPILWHDCSCAVGNVGVQALISRAVS